MTGLDGEVVDGLRLVRAAERRAGLRSRPPQTSLHVSGRAVRADGVPELALLAGASGASSTTVDGAGLRASAVLLARLSHDVRRARSFYLGDEPLTMAVQQRRRPGLLRRAAGGGRARLVEASEVQVAWSRLGLPGVRVPEVLSAGADRRCAWVLERMEGGQPLCRRQWRLAGPRLASQLVRAHVALGLQVEPASRHLPAHAAARLRLLAEHEPAGVGPVLARGPHTLAGVATALEGFAAAGHLVTGLCHGDPVAGNVLAAGEDLVLLDWELAGRRPVAHDLLKVVWGQPDQASAFLGLREHLPPASGAGGPAVLPWAHQAAVVLGAALADWPRRWDVAVRSGRERQLRGRLQGQALTLARLLEA